MEKIKISLILATIGRTKEVSFFLQKMVLQTYQNFEIIIIDQNKDSRLHDVMNKFKEKLSIKLVKCEPGLSKARNKGLRHVTGDIIAFPDDDCWYSEHLLNDVCDLFTNNDVDAVTGRCVDDKGKECMGKFSKSNTKVTIYNVWRSAISITIFIKKHVVDDVGYFDEELGAGASSIYKSGEETDYLVRTIKRGYKVQYFVDLVVNHPSYKITGDRLSLERAYFYGCGFGRVLSKNNYPLCVKVWYLQRACLGAVISLLLGNTTQALFRWETFRGRLKGMGSL